MGLNLVHTKQFYCMLSGWGQGNKYGCNYRAPSGEIWEYYYKSKILVKSLEQCLFFDVSDFII